jgi:dipeptidyl aminopeptidase/acylaminoacyl peptidase
VAAALSQPGYGNCGGQPDFCGPFTQQAALVALDFLRQQTFVKPGKIALFGYSRGAIVAAMVATQDQSLAAAPLGAGCYDFFTWNPTTPGIAWNIAEEAGTSSEAYLARSAIYHAEKIKAPGLLLHSATGTGWRGSDGLESRRSSYAGRRREAVVNDAPVVSAETWLGLR